MASEILHATCREILVNETHCSSIKSIYKRILRLPYTEAVLMETLRLSNTAPMSVAHRALSHTQLRGYSIPKVDRHQFLRLFLYISLNLNWQGSVVLINLYSVNSEVKHWADPEIFRPERHLDSSGRLIRSDWLLPFGAGKYLYI